MSKIRKTYEAVESPDEKTTFRHAYRSTGFKFVEDNVLVNSLNTRGDDVVALEAIKASDLASRTVKTKRAPLQNITNLTPTAMLTPTGVKPAVGSPRVTTPATPVNTRNVMEIARAPDRARAASKKSLVACPLPQKYDLA